MTELRVLAGGSNVLSEQVAALEGVTVTDDPRTADCAVTDDPASASPNLPTVVVASDIDAIVRPVAGFCRPDASDTHLRNQLELAARHTPAAARSKAEQLHEVTRRMVGRHDPDEVYQLAAEAAERVLDLDTCYLGEAGAEFFETKATTSGMDEDGYERMRLDEGVAGRTYQTGTAELTDDIAAEQDAKPADDAYRSALSVPIGDLGVFQAAAYEPGAFDEYDRELVELLMSHVAETVTRIRIEARLRERNATIERLHTTATEMVGCETEEDLYATLLAAAERTLRLEVCTVAVADGDTLEVVAAADSTLAPAVGTEWHTERGILGETYRTGESVLVDDIRTDERSAPADKAYRSGLSVPIGDAGVLQAIAAEPGVYDERDQDLAELLASQAAAALAQVRAERELRSERDRLAEFASVLSHDLRNPLNVARGYLDLAEETADPDHFNRVGNAIDRMDRIVDDVLTLARDPIVEETAPVELGEVARLAAEGTGIDKSRLHVDDLRIQADRDRLLRLMENLLANVSDHAGTTPTVWVGPLENGGFYVADDGPGIPEEERDRVFDSGYTTNRAGTGLGLAIIRSIAEAHGWTVELTESEAAGARFEVRN